MMLRSDSVMTVPFRVDSQDCTGERVRGLCASFVTVECEQSCSFCSHGVLNSFRNKPSRCFFWDINDISYLSTHTVDGRVRRHERRLIQRVNS
jgi:hypothetical protein